MYVDTIYIVEDDEPQKVEAAVAVEREKVKNEHELVAGAIGKLRIIFFAIDLFIHNYL